MRFGQGREAGVEFVGGVLLLVLHLPEESCGAELQAWIVEPETRDLQKKTGALWHDRRLE